MTIYHTCNDRTPYTYLIGWSKLNKWYYGRRTAKGCHPSDLWTKYFTSSKLVGQFRIDQGEPDVVQVRRCFDAVEKCGKFESRVLNWFMVSNNPMWLNIREGDTGKFDFKYSCSGHGKNKNKVSVFNACTNQFQTVTKEEYRINDNLISRMDSMFVSKESRLKAAKKCSESKKGRKRTPYKYKNKRIMSEKTIIKHKERGKTEAHKLQASNGGKKSMEKRHKNHGNKFWSDDELFKRGKTKTLKWCITNLNVFNLNYESITNSLQLTTSYRRSNFWYKIEKYSITYTDIISYHSETCLSK